MTASLAFTGHRPAKLGGYSPEAQTKLYRFALEFLKPRQEGISVCFSGMALGWDQAVALACMELRLPFVAAVPFAGQESAWPKVSQQQYKAIIAHAKEVVVVCPGEYEAYKMQVRNEYMVDHADALVALWDGSAGGTANCVRYAQSKGKRIKNLWSDWRGL